MVSKLKVGLVSLVVATAAIIYDVVMFNSRDINLRVLYTEQVAENPREMVWDVQTASSIGLGALVAGSVLLTRDYRDRRKNKKEVIQGGRSYDSKRQGVFQSSGPRTSQRIVYPARGF